MIIGGIHLIDIDNIFKYKVPDREKLLANGFVYADRVYTKDVFIMRKQFVVQISVTDTGAVHFKVFDTETNEEYVLVHVPGARGAFVGDVRKACEKVLIEVSNKCFHTELLRAEQTRRIVEFIKENYGAEPEFLWEKYPNYAAFRNRENEKWFAVIMTIDRSKLGLPGHGNIEIIDLKDIPDNVEQRIDENVFFKAYHMNKKHWYTICLDGSVSDEQIKNLSMTLPENAVFSRALKNFHFLSGSFSFMTIFRDFQFFFDKITE
ncbi:MmcQ/YjbR family DNA-binding protein [Roseburia hominis]